MFTSLYLWVKRQLIVAAMFIVRLFGVDVHQHLSNPGNGIGYWLVKRIFKNNNPASCELLRLVNIPSTQDCIIVELGFGPGDTLRDALQMAPKTAKLYGFEISQSMLEDAQKNLQAEPRVQLSLRDCATEGLPFPDGTVDVVYHANVLYFVPDPLALLKETSRALKPGGKLGMSLVVPDSFVPLPEESPFKNILSQDEITHLCTEAGFSQINVHPYKDALERMLVVATK